MAGGKNRHNDIAMNSTLSLGSQLRGRRCRPQNSDTKIRVIFGGSVSFYYPDLSVSCERNDDEESFQDRPVVIMEVLSKSTMRRDTSEKMFAYLSIKSLMAYLVVEQEKPAVTVHRRQETGEFDSEFYGSLGDVIPLPEIEADLPLADIYAGIDFE
jgi:Uma2 family endonuclease